MRYFALMILAAAVIGHGQTQVDLSKQSKKVNFSAASSTIPFRIGTALPAICITGEMFFKTDAVPGNNLNACTATNVWTNVNGSVPLSGPGFGSPNQVYMTNSTGDAAAWRTLVPGASMSPFGYTAGSVTLNATTGTGIGTANQVYMTNAAGNAGVWSTFVPGTAMQAFGYTPGVVTVNATPGVGLGTANQVLMTNVAATGTFWRDILPGTFIAGIAHAAGSVTINASDQGGSPPPPPPPSPDGPCAVDYTDALANFPEPTVPTVALNGSYTTMCNKVYRMSDTTSTGVRRWLSHSYVNRSPLSLNNAHMVVLDSSANWFFIPISWSGTAPNEVPVGGAFVPIPVGGAGKPAGIGNGLWSPVDANKYCTIDHLKMWCINPTTMAWTMTKDFASFIPDMSAFNAASGTCAPYNNTGSGILPYLLLTSWTSNGAKMLFSLQQSSKNSFGVIEYTIATDTVRINVGKNVNNKLPVLVDPGPTRLHSAEWDKTGNYLILQEGEAEAGDSSNPCTLGGRVHQYVVAAGASNMLGVGGTPSYVLHGNEIVGHGVTLTNSHAAYSNDIDGWRFTTPSEFTQGIRKVDITGVPSVTAPYRYPQTISFAWPYGVGVVGGYHLSANTLSSQRWVALSTYQETATPRSTTRIAHEIVAVDMNASTTVPFGANPTGWSIRRLGHHFSWPGNIANAPPPPPGTSPNTYYIQPHASTSFDGKFIVFGSSFGNQQESSVFIMIAPASVRP